MPIRLGTRTDENIAFDASTPELLWRGAPRSAALHEENLRIPPSQRCRLQHCCVEQRACGQASALPIAHVAGPIARGFETRLLAVARGEALIVFEPNLADVPVAFPEDIHTSVPEDVGTVAAVPASTNRNWHGTEQTSRFLKKLQ